MKKEYFLPLTLIVVLAMTGCGNNQIQGFNEEHMEVISMEVMCKTTPDFENYVELQSGDRIVQDTEQSSVRLYHNENNHKVVCLEQGQVHIERPLS
ncbi:MAG: Unknown protein [uncultured Sulfurovum sp.]|uniref:Lipoprotein n=1 Tax=uncultured Sulfurovum sp. TaxID=269237 RepID=A0A6S6SHE3_9BACT|nr:MAG: Unknown protein [uncultured Sulfurovum sp.]